eukprot:286592_1
MRQLLVALVVGLVGVLIYPNIHKCRVYEMSKIECIIVRSLADICFPMFQIKNTISDVLYLDTPNEHLSKEYRAFKQIMKLLQALPSLDINADQATYLTALNKSINVMQYIVPIPASTQLSSGYLRSDSIGTETTNQSQFHPQTTYVIWIVGDEHVPNETDSKTIVYLHGGSYVSGGLSHLGFASQLSIATQTRVAYVCYDVPPAVGIPQQVDQVLTVYFYLVMRMEIPAQNIIIAGDSAGGGLSLLAVQKIGLNNWQHMYPNGVVVLSPWVDLGLSAPSYQRNKETDVMIIDAQLRRNGKIASDHNEENFKNGFYSALYGPVLEQLPRMYFAVSKHETLFDDSEQLVAKFKADTNHKVILKYDMEEYLCHDWAVLLGVFPEADQSFATMIATILDWYDS